MLEYILPWFNPGVNNPAILRWWQTSWIVTYYTIPLTIIHIFYTIANVFIFQNFIDLYLGRQSIYSRKYLASFYFVSWVFHFFLRRLPVCCSFRCIATSPNQISEACYPMWDWTHLFPKLSSPQIEKWEAGVFVCSLKKKIIRFPPAKTEADNFPQNSLWA